MSHNRREKEFLRREIPGWVDDGLITADQKEKILARYEDAAQAELAAKSPQRVVSWMPVILIVAAVVLVGAGLSLFYAANWRKMTPPLKLRNAITSRRRHLA